jgi:hypothetical protein
LVRRLGIEAAAVVVERDLERPVGREINDKVQVIIAPPQVGFVAAGLLGIKTDPTTLEASPGPGDSSTNQEQR